MQDLYCLDLVSLNLSVGVSTHGSVLESFSLGPTFLLVQVQYSVKIDFVFLLCFSAVNNQVLNCGFHISNGQVPQISRP